MSDSLWPPGLYLYPWDFPGKKTGVGCHFLLQGIFLTQGLNPHLLCFLLYPFFFWLPSHLDHHRALSRVPCAIQQVLNSDLLVVYVCVTPNFPTHPIFYPLVSICLLSTSVVCCKLCVNGFWCWVSVLLTTVMNKFAQNINLNLMKLLISNY